MLVVRVGPWFSRFRGKPIIGVDLIRLYEADFVEDFERRRELLDRDADLRRPDLLFLLLIDDFVTTEFGDFDILGDFDFFFFFFAFVDFVEETLFSFNLSLSLLKLFCVSFSFENVKPTALRFFSPSVSFRDWYDKLSVIFGGLIEFFLSFFFIFLSFSWPS